MKLKLTPSQQFRFQIAIFFLEALITILMYIALRTNHVVLGRILSSALILGIISLVVVQ